MGKRLGAVGGALVVVLIILAVTTEKPLPASAQSVSNSATLRYPKFTTAPPPRGGYFQLQPVGSFASLPTDSQAAARVHRSSWEPRSENFIANHTVATSRFKTLDYSNTGYSGMEYHRKVFGRVTGKFTGTTDEIIQWAAVKWGLPDEVIRAQAVEESKWYQGLKDSRGRPVNKHGYGDFGDCGGSPAPSGYGANGPSSFGLMQAKWCALKDPSAPGYDGWPWTEYSTAYAVDIYAAVIRGCYEGWDSWLGDGYHSGDLWGCIGRWYTGAWYDASAKAYIARVQGIFIAKPWLRWTSSHTR